jgi:hypothetical protein
MQLSVQYKYNLRRSMDAMGQTIRRHPRQVGQAQVCNFLRSVACTRSQNWAETSKLFLGISAPSFITTPAIRGGDFPIHRQSCPKESTSLAGARDYECNGGSLPVDTNKEMHLVVVLTQRGRKCGCATVCRNADWLTSV